MTRLLKLLREPGESPRDVETAAGGSRQFRVTVLAVLREATRNTMKPLIKVGVLRQGQVDDRAPTPAIAIFERMQCPEPTMRGSGAEKTVDRTVARALEPVEKSTRLARLPKVPRNASMARHSGVIMLLDRLRNVERSAMKSRAG